MSVAFRRESDEEHLEPKFELPIPPGPNYVTPAGLAQIEARVGEFEALAAAAADAEAAKPAQRDLRYWRQRLASAQPAPAPAAGTVGIGSMVAYRFRGEDRTMIVTGHDEADPAHGKVAFAAPLARAMMGAEAGEWVEFAGEEGAIEILSVSAPA